MNAEAADGLYRLRVLTRCTVAGMRLRPGSTLCVPHNRLRVAAHLVRCGTARPDDERARLDIELYQMLDAALPR